MTPDPDKPKLRQQQEQDRQENQPTYRQAFHYSHDAIFLHDLDGNILDVNQRAVEQFGYTRDEFLSIRIPDIHPPGALALCRQCLEQVCRTGSVHFEIEFQRRNGSMFPGDVTANLFTVDGKRIVQGIVRETTEQKRLDRQLRASEERFRHLANTLPLTVFEIDREGRLTFVNDSGLRMFGYSRADVDRGLYALDMIAPADRSRGRKTIRHMLRTRSDNLSGREYQALRKDGSTFDMIIYDSVILDQDQVQGLQGVIFDISERKQMEDALSHREQQYRTTLESMADGIHLVDRDMNIQIFNEAFLEFCRRAGVPTELAGRSLFEVFDFLPEKVRCEYEQVWNSAEPLNTEEETRLGEKTIYTETRKIPIVKQQRVTHILTIVRDITERKMSEQTLQRSENLLRTIINAAQEAMISIGQDGLIRLFNPAAQTMFQRSKTSMIGQPLDCLMPETFRRQHRRYVASYFAKGQPSGALGKTLELPGLRANGEEFPMEISLSSGRAGTEKFVIAVARDISARKTAEKELREYQQRLKYLASELSLAEERQRRQVATELHENIGQLLAMTKIKLGMLQESSHTPGEAEQLKEMRDLLDKTIAYTRSLTLDLSPPVLYELGLKAALEWLIEQFRQQHDLDIHYRDEGPVVRINDDLRGLLYRTVRELLVNVVKHAQARRVRVRVLRTPKEIEITVADDGRGFPSPDVVDGNHLWEGFGLFNMRERFAHFGGRVQIHSQTNRGATVNLFVPVIHPE
ncbi:MAG: PAS domain S-box protein [Sedimentisphaerales bacterium]|nr:PAS domain S-box protein [Sedimentisphaerales bacterium]